MLENLSLVVLQNKRVVEAAELAWMEKTIAAIVPKRSPDASSKKSKFWLIADAKREVFAKHVDKILDKTTSEKESLFGYFGIMGIASRWFAEKRVKWGLYLSANKIVTGEPLKR